MREEITKEDRGNLLLSWKIPEYTKYERGRNWFIIAGIIFVLLLLYAFYILDFLFVVILVLVAVIFGLRAKEEPMEIDFSILENGISVGKKFYPWKDLDAFYMIYEPPEVKKLYFDPKGLRFRISIPLVKQNPLKVREVLLKYLFEDVEQEKEPLSEEFSRFLKL